MFALGITGNRDDELESRAMEAQNKKNGPGGARARALSALRSPRLRLRLRAGAPGAAKALISQLASV
eukprot:4298870-Prymnesium_polylepis.1